MNITVDQAIDRILGEILPTLHDRRDRIAAALRLGQPTDPVAELLAALEGGQPAPAYLIEGLRRYQRGEHKSIDAALRVNTSNTGRAQRQALARGYTVSLAVQLVCVLWGAMPNAPPLRLNRVFARVAAAEGLSVAQVKQWYYAYKGRAAPGIATPVKSAPTI